MKRAVILSGGKGSRLKPYTVVLPKPLMPIGEYSILEVIIRQLAYYGFNHITLAVNHLAELFKAFFGDGSKWNMKIDYSVEDRFLGTMGPIKQLDDLPENFIVMNGDVLTDLNYEMFFKKHCNRHSIFTVSTYTLYDKSEYGIFELDKKHRIIKFSEKPVTKQFVSMGIYALNKSVINYIPEYSKFGFDDLMYKLIEEKQYPNTSFHEGEWLDIGNPDDYSKAIEIFEKNPDKFLR